MWCRQGDVALIQRIFSLIIFRREVLSDEAVDGGMVNPEVTEVFCASLET